MWLARAAVGAVVIWVTVQLIEYALRLRDERFATAAGTVCVCGHERETHEHYRPGSDCGACGAEACPAWVRPGRADLADLYERQAAIYAQAPRAWLGAADEVHRALQRRWSTEEADGQVTYYLRDGWLGATESDAPSDASWVGTSLHEAVERMFRDGGEVSKDRPGRAGG